MGHSYLLSYERAESFPYFSVIFSVFICRNSLYTMKTNPLSIVYAANVSFQFVAYLFPLLMVYFAE